MPPPYTNLYDLTTHCYCFTTKSLSQSEFTWHSHKIGHVVVEAYLSSISLHLFLRCVSPI